jgi:predicted DNA-binding transcriptional regulator AlpA
MEPLITLDEAAGLLKLSRAQMYELTRNRSRCRQTVPLPVIRLGKRKMFRASSLHAWITELEKQSASKQ